MVSLKYRGKPMIIYVKDALIELSTRDCNNNLLPE